VTEWPRCLGVLSARSGGSLILRRWLLVSGALWAWAAADTNLARAVDKAHAEAALADSLDELIGEHRGQVSVLIRHLDSGAEFAFRAEEVMPTASLIKLPVMIAAYQRVADGQLDLKKRVTFREDDRTPGSGILTQHFAPGVELSLRDCVRLMIAYSDNSATNLLLREIGLNAVNDQLAKWTCPQTRIHALVYRPDSSISPADSQKWGLGKTTARETADLLQRLERGALVSPEACRDMLDHLLACEDRARLGQLLPEGTRIALKTGAVTAARTAAGILYSPQGPIVVCVFTAENKDRRWSDDNASYRLSAEVARAAWNVFNPDPKQSSTAPADGRLLLGSQGLLVEDLQRTLNARLTPSPQVTVDGDFGPQTKLALLAFQKQAGIAESGLTDANTWKALSPLVSPATTEKEAGAEAEAPRQPADALDGPPIVSCRSWVVGDANTGTLFAGHDAETPRDIASTTKIMTAYVILKHAAENAAMLDQQVTFSPAADDTPGSTAGVRTGERCPVKDLLLGLMLPSGNDAAVALAEHFGPVFGESAEAAPVAGLERFVAEMNRAAASLEMSQTKYVNPHGLTHAEHRSSARDQFRLAVAALKLPLFREIVSVRRHRCHLQGPGGYVREIEWTNTNRLLHQDGFAGVKTGTTSAAGACLVSLGTRDGREAITVVLGATSSETRYVDTRNLFRWYWQSLVAK